MMTLFVIIFRRGETMPLKRSRLITPPFQGSEQRVAAAVAAAHGADELHIISPDKTTGRWWETRSRGYAY